MYVDFDIHATMCIRLLFSQLLDLPHECRSKPLLWKALLRLSRKSGLHPTCFNLSRLEKVGQQMAGGGFGDIWRGLVDGQTVAVKSIRIFLEEDVQTASKVRVDPTFSALLNFSRNSVVKL